MTQQNVLELLKKNKCWMTTQEIQQKLKLSSATDNLKKLTQQGEIECIERKRNLSNMYKVVELPKKTKKSSQNRLFKEFKGIDRYDEGLNEGFRLALDSISKLKNMRNDNKTKIQ